MDVKAIIPFKKDGAKSRLGHFLSESEREELALTMLEDVLVALSKSKIAEAEIISTGSGDEIAEEVKVEEIQVNATKATLTVSFRQDERELNEALNSVLTKEKEPVLILMADVPLTTPESINELIAHEEDVVIVPGRKGGTNALFLRKPYEFLVSYYGTSYLAHRETAKQRNLSHAVYDSFFISADIDEVEDLIELLIHGNGFAADYLRSLGVRLKANKNLKTRAVLDRNEK
jgi:2-phospho-L-lactate guanylyltransferase